MMPAVRTQRKKIRINFLMEAILLFITVFFLSAAPRVSAAGEAQIALRGGGGKTAQEYIPGEDEWEDPEELFAGYVDQEMFAAGDEAAGKEEEDESGSSGGNSSESSTGKVHGKSNTGLSQLTGNDLKIYKVLKDYAAETAAGTRASTEYEISLDALGVDQVRYKASDLGFSEFEFVIKTEDGESWKELTEEQADALYEKLDHDLSKIITALLVDSPYELYWYDKTAQTKSFLPGYSGTSDGQNIYFVGSLTVCLPVEKEYALSGETYKVDTEVGQRVQTSVTNAAGIVKEYSNVSDYDKLDGYREEICDLASYHKQAMTEDWDYGNPWQLIWVFDGDPATNVVCEGYAKAFQYLCDLSQFDGTISCILVSGDMDGGTGAGSHMWNIVRMEDGENYLVDITNCDEDTVGSDRLLFLAGAESGSLSGGYLFACNGYNINYNYDSKIISYYSANQLTVKAGGSYQPSQERVCAVTFDANGHGTAPDHQAVEAGDKATRPTPDPLAAGWRFTGWFTDAACENAFDFNTEIYDDILLFAGWEEEEDRQPIDQAKITGLTAKTRTGKAICPAVHIELDGVVLKPGTDYDLAYANNVNVGTATLTITGKGYYTGMLTRAFRILPKNINSFKLKKAKKAFTVQWTRQTDQTTGYQIQYSLKSDFKSSKTMTLGKNKKVSVKVKKLKRKKKYYVRMRTFRKIGKVLYYSNWSKKLAVKTK